MRLKSIAAGTALLIVLAIGTLQSVRALWTETRHRSLSFRWQALTADLDQRQRFTQGIDEEIFRLLGGLGPDESILAVRYDARQLSTVTRLESLLYPIRVFHNADLRRLRARSTPGNVYLLNLLPDAPMSEPGWQLVAASTGAAGGRWFELFKIGAPIDPAPVASSGASGRHEAE